MRLAIYDKVALRNPNLTNPGYEFVYAGRV